MTHLFSDIEKKSILNTSERFFLYCDGGSRGNPGISGAGFWIADKNGKKVAEGSFQTGVNTNNFAEYSSLIGGLEAALKQGITNISICMDSLLVVEQINGNWKVKNPILKPLHQKAYALTEKFEHIELVHIPREKNTYADKLANQAMDNYSD